ncbi:MAG: DMT family transporter [Planctomycetia bacterium]|nr:DMT family transporter [Planctomycetia bacterium]
MDVARSARFRLLLAAALFSTGGVAIKGCGLSPWQVSAFRSGIGALTLLALAPESRRGWTLRTLVVGLAYAGTVTLFALANRMTTSANAIFLQSTAPLYLLLLGPWLLREPLHRRDLAFLGALAVGMALFFVGVEPASRTAPDPGLGNALAAASGLCWALTILGLRWLGRDGTGGAGATVVGNLLGCALALPFALPLGASTPTDWALVTFLGVVQIGVSYVLVTRATRHVPALEATLLLLLEPVLNPIWSWLVHGERPGPWSLLGGAIILIATFARARGSGRAEVPEPPLAP